MRVCVCVSFCPSICLYVCPPVCLSDRRFAPIHTNALWEFGKFGEAVVNSARLVFAGLSNSTNLHSLQCNIHSVACCISVRKVISSLISLPISLSSRFYIELLLFISVSTAIHFPAIPSNTPRLPLGLVYSQLCPPVNAPPPPTT